MYLSCERQTKENYNSIKKIRKRSKFERERRVLSGPPS